MRLRAGVRPTPVRRRVRKFLGFPPVQILESTDLPRAPCRGLATGWLDAESNRCRAKGRGRQASATFTPWNVV